MGMRKVKSGSADLFDQTDTEVAEEIILVAAGISKPKIYKLRYDNQSAQNFFVLGRHKVSAGSVLQYELNDEEEKYLQSESAKKWLIIY